MASDSSRNSGGKRDGRGRRRAGSPVAPPVAKAPARGPRGGGAPPAPALAPEAGGHGRQLLWLGLAAAAVVVFFASARMTAPAPWSYDEYYHLGLARELRAHFPLRSFPWTPFSLVSERFADGVPLFHLSLMPFTGLSIERAGLAGMVVGQVFVVACLGVALWRLGARPAWAYMLGMATLGSLVALRLDMCRPQLLLIGFSLLCIGLLVTGARSWVLAVVTALFALAHAGAWIAIFYAAVWGAAGWFVPAPSSGTAAPGPTAPSRGAPGPAGRGESRRFLWQPLLWVAAGWILGLLMHPNFPHNLRLMAMVNLMVPFEASPAGNAALRSQIGEELMPPGLGILAEQWTIFLAPLVVAVTLLRERHLRTRATLATAQVTIAFLLLGALLLRRMLELGAPLALLALAALAVERRRQGLGGLLGGWTSLAAAGALLVGALWTAATVRMYGFGRVSQPQEMARWLGEHGRPGERVFTAQWADSAPLFYSAPQLQSLVALDPTLFFAKDPRLFQEYVDVIQGRRQDPARTIRQRFGARWVTIWQAPVYERFAENLVASPGVQMVYKDPYYLIADLGAR